MAQNMLTGEYPSTIEDDATVTIPAPCQSLLENHQIVIKRGFGNNHLVIHAPSSVEEIMKKLKKYPKKHTQPIIRQTDARFVEVDQDYRFVVPEDLLPCINRDKQLIWIGLGNRAELWNRETLKMEDVKNDLEMQKQKDKLLNS